MERTSAGAAGSPPGVRRRKAGTDHRTVVADHGDGNSRRLPLLTAVEGVPREARKREAACLRPSFVGRVISDQRSATSSS
jgi:hypothetical protein